jgi:CRP/FNR family cyclic AMP-dependent transcriptional regulator
MSNVLLPRLGILAFMDDDDRAQLATYGYDVATEPKQVLLNEGAESQILYFVLAGTFSITVAAPGRDAYLDLALAGDCLGEISLFEREPASATVTSSEKGRLWAIDSDSLERFLQDWPLPGCALILGINTLLSRRLRKATAVIKVGQIVPSFLSVRSRNRTRI